MVSNLEEQNKKGFRMILLKALPLPEHYPECPSVSCLQITPCLPSQAVSLGPKAAVVFDSPYVSVLTVDRMNK